MQKALIIVHVIISLALIIVVLMQHGKQQGLSGAIAGGAETFFGKNKGRTVDAMLKKFTSVIAALFIISSVTLAFVSVNENKKSQNAADAAQTQTNGAAQNATVKLDDKGNLVDESGNVVMTAEQMKEQEQKSGDASADENKTENNDAEKKDDSAAEKKAE